MRFVYMIMLNVIALMAPGPENFQQKPASYFIRHVNNCQLNILLVGGSLAIL